MQVANHIGSVINDVSDQATAGAYQRKLHKAGRVTGNLQLQRTLKAQMKAHSEQSVYCHTGFLKPQIRHASWNLY